MIQKNVFYHSPLMHNIALVAQARMMPLNQLHDQIMREWLMTEPPQDAPLPDHGPDMVAVYMQEDTFTLLESRLKCSSPKKTYSDEIRMALAWWLKTMDLDSPLNPTEGNGQPKL